MESILQKAFPLGETIHHHQNQHQAAIANSPPIIEKKLNTSPVTKSPQPVKPSKVESPLPSPVASVSNPTTITSLSSLTTNQKFARALHMIESERLRIREFLKVSFLFSICESSILI